MGVKATTRSIRALKGTRPIVCLTAYDAVTARIADQGGADLILVGDSVGNTVLGMADTVGVTLEMMVHHTAAVVRAKPAALVIADLPFGLAHDSFPNLSRLAVRSCSKGAPKASRLKAGLRSPNTSKNSWTPASRSWAMSGSCPSVSTPPAIVAAA